VIPLNDFHCNLYNKRVRPTKKLPQPGISYLEKESYLRLGLGEIEGRYIETERHRIKEL
jgi:hypothetical protein